MRVYWCNGALQFEPETSAEWDALLLLGDNIKLGMEARRAESIPACPANNTGDVGYVAVTRDEVRTD